MRGSRGVIWAVAFIGILLIGTAASALDFDFTTLGGNNTQLAHSQTVNGITAEAFNNALLNSDGLLWLRVVPGADDGIGVCNNQNGAGNCISGGGDVNELDQLNNQERIRLHNTNGGTWTSLWVSSLDGNGSNATLGPEDGTVCSSNDGTTTTGCFHFSFTDIAPDVEVDLFTLAGFAGSGLDTSAPFLIFQAGGSANDGTNNDYLVWRGSVNVPEPATLSLLGVGLVGLGVAARRRRAK